MSYVSTIRSGAEIDRRLDYVKYLESLNSQPVGIKWTTTSSSPVVTLVDIAGNMLVPTASFFNNHSIWGGIKRCLIDRTTKAITYGTTNAGSDLTLDGSEGDVFVEIPAVKYKYQKVGNDVYLWVVPYFPEDTDYTIHPAFTQRSDTVTLIKPKIYVSAYEPALLVESTGTLKLQSATGLQPMVGGGIYKVISFNSGGTNTISIGETLTGATSGATGIIIGFYLASGSWAGGDATGNVYVKNVSGTFTAENLNGTLTGSNVMTSSGAATDLTFTLSNAETYASNMGDGFGACNFWTLQCLKLLMYIEYRTLSLQGQVGVGIVGNNTGTGFGGKSTGADSIDSRLNSSGTGTGNGTSGTTPVAWRGIENPWGNCWAFANGFNVYTDGTYRILKRDGTGIPATTLASGSYESGSGLSTSSGYISGIAADEMGALAFLPTAVDGSSTTYFCDYFWANTEHTPAIVLEGGSWIQATASTIGPNCRDAERATNISLSYVGTRIEYIPQEVE